MIANAIVYYNSAILSRLLTTDKTSGNETALALITSTSPVAWRHVHLNGCYAFRDGGQALDLDAINQAPEAGVSAAGVRALAHGSVIRTPLRASVPKMMDATVY